MPLMSGSKTYDPVDNFNTTPGLFDLHPAIGLYFASPAGHILVSTTSPLPVTGGGGGVGITDTDDNSLASAQTTLLAIDENYIFDGTVWIRWQGGIDNAVAPVSPQGAFVAGIVTDPLDVFVDGDISLLHFDTSGRLLVNAEGVTDTDDNSIASGQTTGLFIDLSYVFDSVAGAWIRWQGGVDNAVAPAAPQIGFVGGKVTSPLDTYADGDVSSLNLNTRGRLLVQPRGATITAGANTAVGVGATVALPALPAGTLAITVQNKTAGAASRVLIRQVGGAAGTGISLATLGTITFDNAVAALEAENIAGPAATVGIIFEAE